METYEIVRLFFDGNRETIKKGLSLEEAKEWCSDDDTSSKTCSTIEGMERTREKGHWFEAFYAE